MGVDFACAVAFEGLSFSFKRGRVIFTGDRTSAIRAESGTSSSSGGGGGGGGVAGRLGGRGAVALCDG